MHDKELKPSLVIKVKTLIKLILVEECTYKICSKYNFTTAFLGHAVYKYRIILETLRKKNINIFCQSNWSLHKQYKKNDIEWTDIDHKFLKNIKKNVNRREVGIFYNRRSKGKMNDADFLAASKIKKKLNFEIPKNVVFLHVFKDSPFASIDSKRIFFDYYHWIIETIKILETSDETWSLRTHPNSTSWGENSLEVLNQIKKKYFKNRFSDNIIIDDKYVSNLLVFKNMSRCVTFSGTASIEAATYGVKPILIANNALYKLDKKLAHKPETFEEYKKLLLKKSSDKIFIQNKKNITNSKYLLYALYNILSCRQNMPKVVSQLFSNTSDKIKYLIFKSLIDKVRMKTVKKKLKTNGLYLSNGGPRTLNLNFINLFKDYC